MTNVATSATKQQTVTESEYAQIQEERDNWLVGGVNSRKKLHIYKCLHLDKDPERMNEITVDEKPINSFPFGYRDICIDCLEQWRDERDNR